MMRRNHLVVAVIGLTTGAMASAGPLTPPPGPPGPTGKTLTEVEPRIPVNAETAPADQAGFDAQFTIIEPGSYYLTGDIDGVDGKSSIVILADNVTLDLNGFTVRGPGSSGFQPGQAAINAPASQVVIRNGRVGDTEGIGIYIDLNGVVEDIVAFSCDDFGIIGATQVTVRRCAVTECGNGGIALPDGGMIVDSSVFDVVEVGIAATDAVIERCRVELVESGPAFALSATSLISSVAVNSGQQGAIATNGSVIRDCLIAGFGFAGIELDQAGGLMNANLATGNMIRGTPETPVIVVNSAGNRIEGNSIIVDGDVPTGVGIRTIGAGGGNIVINNSVRGAATAFELDPADAAGPIIGPADIATATSPFANIAH